MAVAALGCRARRVQRHPAAEGGTSNPYIPSAGDLGMWLKAKATFDLTYHYDPDYDPDDPDPGNNVTFTDTGRTGEANTQQPVLAKAVVSNAGFIHPGDGFSFAVNTTDPDSNRTAQAFTTGPGPTRLLAAGSAPRAVQKWRRCVRDVGGACRRRRQAGGRAVVGDAPLPSIDNGDDTFEELTIPGGLRLQPGTKYWTVISQTTPVEEGLVYYTVWTATGEFLSELWIRANTWLTQSSRRTDVHIHPPGTAGSDNVRDLAGDNLSLCSDISGRCRQRGRLVAGHGGAGLALGQSWHLTRR